MRTVSVPFQVSQDNVSAAEAESRIHFLLFSLSRHLRATEEKCQWRQLIKPWSQIQTSGDIRPTAIPSVVQSAKIHFIISFATASVISPFSPYWELHICL